MCHGKPSQPSVGSAAVEAIDLQPAQQLHNVLVVVVDECLTADDQASFDQLHQQIAMLIIEYHWRSSRNAHGPPQSSGGTARRPLMRTG
jgi:hypothetical protein